MNLTEKIACVRGEILAAFPNVVLKANSVVLASIAECDWGDILLGKGWKDLTPSDTYTMYSLPWEVDESTYCSFFPSYIYQVFDPGSDALYNYMGTHLRLIAINRLDKSQVECVCRWINVFREYMGEDMQFVEGFDLHAETKFCHLFRLDASGEPRATSHLRGQDKQK